MRRKSPMQRRMMLALAGAGAAVLVPKDADAQSGNVQRPMPDVLLLVDTSGSMERMHDGSLPGERTFGAVPSECVPGVESYPNRWGMLLQALTGNMQPFYSCAKQSRTSDAFRNEYKINDIAPYDTQAEYFLPYHRPLTGIRAGTLDTVCAIGPHRLPGAPTGSGVGPGRLGYATVAGQGGDVTDFPDDALITAKWTHMEQRYAVNAPLDSPLGNNACVFDQSNDGQLDAARDYVRFALMTFDSDVEPGIGVNGGIWPPQNGIDATNPFLGQWSYLRSSANPAGGGPASGLPMDCIGPNLPFEVGARHWGAPPWEGRMVPFPPPDATLHEIHETNERIQRVLLATRPYGATPIDAMLDDARDYLWYNPIGPSSSDPYVRDAGCRDRYIILLTDGAPNLNMRPSCEGPGGVCPINGTAADIAKAMYDDTSRRVTTFVIGFSVNGESGVGGDGFPPPFDQPPNNNCKAWYASFGNDPQAMASACTANPPPPNTAAAACCVLNEIAYKGSGGETGPFFAESQADIVLSFGKILAAVTKAVSTRTVPAATPTAYVPPGFTATTTAEFLASFIPNAQKPWSGEIVRHRAVCEATEANQPKTAVDRPPNPAEGDSMAVNLAAQSAENRLFLTFIPDPFSVGPGVNPPTDTAIDAAGTIRPFYTEITPTPNEDGAPKQTGVEVSGLGWELRNEPNIRLALDIDKRTCKRGRAASTSGSGTIEIPALDLDDGQACTDVVLGFLTGHPGDINKRGTVSGGLQAEYNFNVRCRLAGGTPSAGTCSISGQSCNVGANDCPVAGEVCVPNCAPLGAIYRANPVVIGPPDALLREQGYRDFQAAHARRKPVLFAVTTDGILHAFKATEQAAGAHHELWSFVPPAVLPKLASNYPAGNQILLDGTPVVKDTVWDRAVTDPDFDKGTKWHTTLVAGLGEGGGYYALNVTDADCSQRDPAVNRGECAVQTGATGYDIPAKGDLDQAGRSRNVPAKRGPHFLWQLTDVPQSPNLANETAKVTRRGRDGKNYVALFGRRTGTPAITTLQMKVDGVDRQIGVAILPGGIDGPPIKGQKCTRNLSDTENAADPAFPPRTEVRRWVPGTDPSCPEAVPGRSVTIVRLDTGQIIRHFGRSQDVPETIRTAPGVFQAAPFMSPMVGTPVVYPQTTGAVAQKIFIGDADGNLWRIDVSSTDPNQWKVQLFADLLSGHTAEESQPIQVTPIISLDPSGNLIVNVATGDQDSIIYKPGEKNYVFSIEETRPTTTAEPPRARVKWFEELNDGERVTGPMTVFDRTLYFATFAPKVPPSASQCHDAGTGKIWGLNYYVADPANGGGPSAGGQPMWCANVEETSGICLSTSLVKNQAITTGEIIPGVTLRASQACADISVNTDEWASTGFSAFTTSQFKLSFGVGTSATSGNAPPSATLRHITRPLPRISTRVDAWALVVD